MVSTRTSILCGVLAALLLLSEFPGTAKAGGGCSCRRSQSRSASWRCLLVCGSVSMGDGRVSSLPVKRATPKISTNIDFNDIELSHSEFLNRILTAAKTWHRTALENAERLVNSIPGSSLADDADVFDDQYMS